jgi:hypothetical protein
MEKETCHIFISLFVLQGRGGMGVYFSFTINVHILQVTWSVGDLFSNAMSKEQGNIENVNR